MQTWPSSVNALAQLQASAAALGLSLADLLTQLTPPLISARTVHVNSATGSDTAGDGSASNPWATVAKAWADRKRFGQLAAVYTMITHGAGPYTMPRMDGSTCIGAGAFVWLGDTETVVGSGTFAGDLSATTNVVATAAGLGSDVFKYDYIRVTSGALTGAVMQIAFHSDASITVGNSRVRTTAAAAIVNGDTFSIVRPATEVVIPTTTSGAQDPAFADLTGGGPGLVTNLANAGQGHLFYGLRFTGQPVRTTRANCQFGFCRLEAGLQVSGGLVTCGKLPNGSLVGVGPNAKTDLLSGAGVQIVTAGSAIVFGSGILSGDVYCSRSISVGSGSSFDQFLLGGGRLDGALSVSLGGFFQPLGSSAEYRRVTATITVTAGGRMVSASQPIVFAVTSGNCVQVRAAGLMRLSGANNLSGGTSDAAGYALDVRGGGTGVFVNSIWTVTGGTAGSDLRTTTTTTAANSVLGSNGVGVGVAADALLGEAIYRSAA